MNLSNKKLKENKKNGIKKSKTYYNDDEEIDSFTYDNDDDNFFDID
jgi:hypothetical protein